MEYMNELGWIQMGDEMTKARKAIGVETTPP
jgi:hypothetical protein